MGGWNGVLKFTTHCIFTTRFVNTVAFHPDGNCIAVGTTDNVIKVLYRNS